MKVLIPSALYSYTEHAQVNADGATLSAALTDLDRQYPGIRFRMIDEQERMRPHIRFFVNGEQVHDLARRPSTLVRLLSHPEYRPCQRESHNMPYVNIQITRGATREQKAQLVKDVTNSLVRVLGKKPEHTHVVIQEINEEDWGFSGLLTDEWKKLK